MKKFELKSYLLSTNVFIDNDYLDQYINLIEANKNLIFEGYFEKHHILPVAYYKYIYNCKSRYESEKYAKKDKNNFIVKLLYKDHCKAHWLLYFCTKDYMKQANEAAVRYISGVYLKLTGKEKHKFDFIQEDFDLLQNYMNDIIVNKESRYWTPEEIIYLQENYNGYGAGLQCAKYLNRTLKEVNNKARLLGLAKNCPNWTEEEIGLIRQYYPIEGDMVYKRIPAHTRAACRACAKKLSLRSLEHYWTEKEKEILFLNQDKSMKDLLELLPGRTSSSIKHYKDRHLKELNEKYKIKGA